MQAALPFHSSVSDSMTLSTTECPALSPDPSLDGCNDCRVNSLRSPSDQHAQQSRQFSGRRDSIVMDVTAASTDLLFLPSVMLTRTQSQGPGQD